MASGWGCAGWRVVVGGRSRSRGQGWVRRVAGGGAAGVGDGTSIARSPPLPLSQPAGPSTPESLQHKHPLPVSPTPAPATDPARTPRSLPGERTPRPLGRSGENVNTEAAGEACRGVGDGGDGRGWMGRTDRQGEGRAKSQRPPDDSDRYSSFDQVGPGRSVAGLWQVGKRAGKHERPTSCWRFAPRRPLRPGVNRLLGRQPA